MNANHYSQMAQLVAEEMGFRQGLNSPSNTEITALDTDNLPLLLQSRKTSSTTEKMYLERKGQNFWQIFLNIFLLFFLQILSFASLV